MRALLLGCTDLSLAVGNAIRDAGADLAGVLHVGEEFSISYSSSPVSNVRYADMAGWAQAADIPHQAWSSGETATAFAHETGATIGIAAGWYHMVPRRLRSALPQGCLGLHASLLPELRGGAPLVWAILSGLTKTGVTLFELADGVDDGPIYDQREVPISSRTTIGDLVRDVESASVEMLTSCMPRIADGSLRPRPQTGSPSYCLQRTPADEVIEWSQPAEDIDRLVRAQTHPYRGARTHLDGSVVRIWSSEPVGSPTVLGAPGQIARLPDEPGPVVVTGRGLLRVRAATDDDGSDLTDELSRAANRRFENPR